MVLKMCWCLWTLSLPEMWVPYQFLLVPSINYITKTINDFSCDLVINFSYSQWTHKWWKISFAKKPRKSTVSLINSPWATELSKRETAPGLFPQPISLLVISETCCCRHHICLHEMKEWTSHSRNSLKSSFSSVGGISAISIRVSPFVLRNSVEIATSHFVLFTVFWFSCSSINVSMKPSKEANLSWTSHVGFKSRSESSGPRLCTILVARVCKRRFFSL